MQSVFCHVTRVNKVGSDCITPCLAVAVEQKRNEDPSAATTAHCYATPKLKT